MANQEKLFASFALEEMKSQIASELGINLGGETTSRENGSVGGEMVKRLVAMAQHQLAGVPRERVIRHPVWAKDIQRGIR